MLKAVHLYKLGNDMLLEHMQDLLQPQNENMQIREGANGNFVEGVHETEVRSTEDCLRLLQMGDRNRYTCVEH